MARLMSWSQQQNLAGLHDRGERNQLEAGQARVKNHGMTASSLPGGIFAEPEADANQRRREEVARHKRALPTGGSGGDFLDRLAMAEQRDDQAAGVRPEFAKQMMTPKEKMDVATMRSTSRMRAGQQATEGFAEQQRNHMLMAMQKKQGTPLLRGPIDPEAPGSSAAGRRVLLPQAQSLTQEQEQRIAHAQQMQHRKQQSEQLEFQARIASEQAQRAAVQRAREQQARQMQARQQAEHKEMMAQHQRAQMQAQREAQWRENYGQRLSGAGGRAGGIADYTFDPNQRPPSPHGRSNSPRGRPMSPHGRPSPAGMMGDARRGPSPRAPPSRGAPVRYGSPHRAPPRGASPRAQSPRVGHTGKMTPGQTSTKVLAPPGGESSIFFG